MSVVGDANKLDRAGDDVRVRVRGRHDRLGEIGIHAVGQLGQVRLHQGALQLVGELAEGQGTVATGVLADETGKRLGERRVVVVEILEIEQLGEQVPGLPRMIPSEKSTRNEYAPVFSTTMPRSSRKRETTAAGMPRSSSVASGAMPGLRVAVLATICSASSTPMEVITY
ncbi:MAG: hypothetical protein ABSG43_18390, partial [Solirubrobacteraceae bacterium]